MYSLLSAKGLDKKGLGNWIDVDAGPQPMFQLFLRYENLLIELSNPDNYETGWTSIYEFPQSVRTTNITLNDYLAQAANGSIKLVNESTGVSIYDPSKPPEYVRSLFTNDYGFHQKLINRAFHPDAELAPDQQIDLLLSHKDIEYYDKIMEQSLITVNGLIHRAEATDEGILVYDGARSMIRGNDNRVGLLDFSCLKGIKQIPFKDDMLLIHPDKDVSRSAYFKLPESIVGKTIFLVLGGMIMFLDPVLDIVGADKVKVNYRFIDLISHYYATRGIIDYGDRLPLTKYNYISDDYVQTAEFYTEDYIRAIMSVSQSFFVIVDSPIMTVKRTVLDNCNEPGQYRTAGKFYPNKPVRIGHGYLPEFNVLEREHYYVLTSPHYLTHKATRHKSENTDYRYTQDVDYGYNPVRYSEAVQLTITAGLA